MLSAAEHFRQVPRSPRKNLVWRLRVLKKARSDCGFRRFLVKRCERDILFWINGFVNQFNPNSIGEGSTESGPFITWEFQEKAVRDILFCIENRHDLLIEKSREMGASWLCLLVMAWMFLFHRNKKFLLMSRSEEAVDKPGDSDSLFWKLDYVFDHLPGWMTAGRLERRKRSYVNPLLKSGITGQASTDKTGVGGRCTAMFLDEFSRVTKDFAVLDSTADTTRCRIFNGTHMGVDTAFYELSRRENVRKLVMHWSAHPDKKKGAYRYDAVTNKVEVLDKQYVYPPGFQFNTTGAPTGGPFPGLRSPWYDEECPRRGSARGVARDLDINPEGSVSQAFDPVVVAELIRMHACEPRWQGDVAYDRETGRLQGLVRSAEGKLKLWIVPDMEGKVPTSEYCLGADTATGVGSTPSCACIGDALTRQKIGEFADAWIREDEFAALCVALCWLFKNASGMGALFCWEGNGAGKRMGQRVIELGYRNVYFRHDDFSLNPKLSDVAGWVPSGQARRVLLEDWRAALFTRAVIDPSETALRELLGFQYVGDTIKHGKELATDDPSGAGVNHGDRGIAGGLMWKMMKLKQTPRVQQKQKEQIVAGSLAWRIALHEEAQKREEAWD